MPDEAELLRAANESAEAAPAPAASPPAAPAAAPAQPTESLVQPRLGVALSLVIVASFLLPQPTPRYRDGQEPTEEKSSA